VATTDPRTGIALTFDDFGWGELKAASRETGISETKLIQRAVAEYVEALDADPFDRSNRVPRFASEPSGPGVTLIEVELTAEQAARLVREASTQQTTLPTLVRHAVFLKLGGDEPG